jgi:hypothetical protein
MSQSLNLIQPLVEHLVNTADTQSAGQALQQAGVFSASEIMALEPAAIQAAYRTLQHVQLMNCSSDELLRTIEQHQVCWPTDLSDEFKQGAISY